MSETVHFYEPARGHGLPHDPFNAIVAPRPIGWISSRDADRRLNLAPYSFFNAFTNPVGSKATSQRSRRPAWQGAASAV